MNLLTRTIALAALLVSVGTAAAHHISGTVYCDTNFNGVIDAATDARLPGVTIRATSLDNPPGQNFSDGTSSSGFYSISLQARTDRYFVRPVDLPPGRTVIVPAGGSYTIQIITGTSQDRAENVNFLLGGCQPPTTTTSTSTTTTTTTTTSTTTTTTTTSTSTTTTTTSSSSTTSTTRPDHYLCYATAGQQSFSVTLSDQFETGQYQSFHRSVRRFCTPADKNGEGITDHDTHLAAIRLKGPHARRTNVRIDNQFGTLFFDTLRTESLLVPSNESLAPAPPPSSPALGAHEHFRCVRVKRAKGTAAFTSRTVQVVDEFGSRALRVIRPLTLCAPTDKNGEGIIDPDNHLVCYKAVASPPHRADGVQIANQFGPLLLKLAREVEFCVPSTKTLAP